MKILAIETSCDETAAAVTRGTQVLSSVKITQEIHSQWGGVVPSLAKRDHEKNIDWVIERALNDAGAKLQISNSKNQKNPKIQDTSSKIQTNSNIQEPNSKEAEIDAIAVTMGPGLAIALGVGIAKAKELAAKYNKPLIAINHVEGHILSCLATEKFQIPNSKFQNDLTPTPLLTSGEGQDFQVRFPCAALVVSGGHTQVVLVEEIGKYKILAESLDDDIGEALDKGARLLDLPYPGGPALEKLAAAGNPKKYQLPLPMLGKETNRFSYAGLKTAFNRLITKLQDTRNNEGLTDEEKADLAAVYQETVFKHLIRITERVLSNSPEVSPPNPPLNLRGGEIQDLLVGGGVIANKELRSRIYELGERLGLTIHIPSDMVLCTDNAAMIGVAAGFKAARGEFSDPATVDRKPRWRVDEL